MTPRATSFEELECWRVARELVNVVYDITKGEHFARDFSLADQLRRASVSVMANMAEGFERGSNREFVRFLFIARGSAAEVRSLFYVALDRGYVDENQFAKCKELSTSCSKLAWGLIRSLRNKPDWKAGIKEPPSDIEP